LGKVKGKTDYKGYYSGKRKSKRLNKLFKDLFGLLVRNYHPSVMRLSLKGKWGFKGVMPEQVL